MSIKINNKEDKTYIVTGVPHSATSLVAKGLHLAGVRMAPRTFRKDLYQEYYMMKLNNKILREAGGTWYKPPSEDSILSVDLEDEISAKIKKRQHSFWGFKDPRTALTARLFFPHLIGDPYFICIFRKPEKVIESYQKSKQGRKYVNRELVDHYNRSIISAIEDFCELK